MILGTLCMLGTSCVKILLGRETPYGKFVYIDRSNLRPCCKTTMTLANLDRFINNDCVGFENQYIRFKFNILMYFKLALEHDSA
jgi:hypothetical protein